MNEHLDPIFKEVIPEIEKKRIDYWVIGGAAVAGIKGEFLRFTNDVDVFVRKEDFSSAGAIIKQICFRHPDWRIFNNLGIKERPKIEIYAKDKEIFSLIPVFIDKDKVHFIFPNGGNIDLPLDVLTPVRRKIGEFKFNTPPNKYIKELFYNHYNLLLQRHKGEEDKSRHLKNYKVDKKFLDSLKIT